MVVLSARNERRQLDEQSGWRSASHQAWRFFVQHVHVLFASHFFTLFDALLGIPGAFILPAPLRPSQAGIKLDEQEAKATLPTCVQDGD